MPVVRRTFSRVLISLVILTVLLPVGSALSPARAQVADTITIGMTDFPRSLDPGETSDLVAWEILSHLYTGLTRQTPGTLAYEPALASGIQASDDRLTYTVTLREGAAFSDGTPITAQTFVDSINRVVALNRDAAKAVTPYV
ncbi:MAG: hypothetical protein JW910_05000, partial [Anaerolineae bacterium]|nr:hypothetical protein [Anaerolineae bacterium]